MRHGNVSGRRKQQGSIVGFSHSRGNLNGIHVAVAYNVTNRKLTIDSTCALQMKKVKRKQNVKEELAAIEESIRKDRETLSLDPEEYIFD